MDHNMGENMYNQNYGQSQPGYDQSQMQYHGMQPGYDQSQMQYHGMQPGYDQSQMQYHGMQPGYDQSQVQYHGMQPGYDQSQMQYQNMQTSYGQPVGYNNQMYSGQMGYQSVPKTRKPVNIKMLIIILSAVFVVALAIIFIPKLFNKVQPPFKSVELGLSLDEVVEKYKIKEKDAHGMDAYKDNVEGFGVEGDLQFCFHNDVLYMVNWYAYEYENDEDDIEKAIDDAKEYYTDKYGKPEKDVDEDYGETRYTWELEDGAELQLSILDECIIIRVVDFSLL